MKEKTKLRTHKFLLALALISLLIATIEGLLFYTNETPFFRLLLILQNSINAFAFKPTISLKDALLLMDKNPDILHNAVGYAYGISLFTAPYCTIAIVYKFLERMMRFVFSFHSRRNCRHISIFGYNDDIKDMIKNLPDSLRKEFCVHIVSDHEFSADERYELGIKGYRIHKINILKADESDLQYLLRKTETDKADDIILFDENSINNFSMLQMFSMKKGDGKFELKSGVKVTCRCELPSISELISDYYRLPDSEKFGYDLEIISLSEIQVRKMFDKIPLYSVYKDSSERLDNWDVKMLIVGFGSLGQQALVQAMDLGVFSSKNKICADIFDCDVQNIAEIFSNRFSADTFEQSGNTIRMKQSVSDGSFEVNFHKVNVRNNEFIKAVRDLNREQKYTYVVIAIDDVDIGVSCAMRIGRIFGDEGMTGVPIVLRMDSDRRLAKYIGENDNTFADVSLLDSRSIVLSLENILNRDINRMAKEFNHFYSEIQILEQGEAPYETGAATIDERWNRIPIFKRDSSKALAAHDSTKTVIFERLAQELGLGSADEKICALIGDEGTLMRCSGNIWRSLSDNAGFLKALDNDEFAKEAAAMEHRRWCFFMASQGWRYGKSRNDLRKLHTCLMPFKELSEDEKGSLTIKYDLMPLMARYIKQKNDAN